MSNHKIKYKKIQKNVWRSATSIDFDGVKLLKYNMESYVNF